jgi:hypothetical protein
MDDTANICHVRGKSCERFQVVNISYISVSERACLSAQVRPNERFFQPSSPPGYDPEHRRKARLG